MNMVRINKNYDLKEIFTGGEKFSVNYNRYEKLSIPD